MELALFLVALAVVFLVLFLLAMRWWLASVTPLPKPSIGEVALTELNMALGTQVPSSLASAGWTQRDPWGREFEYETRRGIYIITTLGADGAPGGSGENQDWVLHSFDSLPHKAGACPNMVYPK